MIGLNVVRSSDRTAKEGKEVVPVHDDQKKE